MTVRCFYHYSIHFIIIIIIIIINIINIIIIIIININNQALERKTITFFITKRLVSESWVKSLKQSKNVAPEVMAATTMLRDRMSEVPSEPSSSSTDVDRRPFCCTRRQL